MAFINWVVIAVYILAVIGIMLLAWFIAIVIFCAAAEFMVNRYPVP